MGHLAEAVDFQRAKRGQGNKYLNLTLFLISILFYCQNLSRSQRVSEPMACAMHQSLGTQSGTVEFEEARVWLRGDK